MLACKNYRLVPQPVLSRKPVMSDPISSSELIALSGADAQAALALSVREQWPHDLRDWQTMVELGNGVGMWVAPDRLGAVGLRFEHGETASTVGMIIVAGEMRGRGLGKQIMRALMPDMTPRRSTWLYATRKGMPLYSGLGFEEVGATYSFRGALQHTKVTSPHAIRTASASELNAIATLDLAAFGAPRITLLERLFKNDGALAIAESNGQVTGYALIRGVGRGSQIGPVVACDEDLALALVRFLGNRMEGSVRIDVPEGASQFRQGLEQAGLSALPREPLMILGKPIPGDRARLFAVASSAYG
jgi:GNAT superfamily N-acetyltransferase